MADSVYLNEPRIVIAGSAWDAYVAFREELTDKEVQQRIKLLHYAHIRRMLEAGLLNEDGALIVTDIPGFDLSLVDAHFPSLQARQTTLFSHKGAEFVCDILARRGHPVSMVQ